MYSWLVAISSAVVVIGAYWYVDIYRPPHTKFEQIVDNKPKVSGSLKLQSTSLYLMGRPLKPVSKPKQNIEELPKTRLNYVLKGLFQSDSKELQGAVIEVKVGAPSFFQPGQEVSEGVKLSEVTSQGVVLDRGGKREVLLAKDFDQVVVVGADRAKPYNQAAGNKARPPTQVEIEDNKRVQSLRERLQALRNQSKNN